MHYSLFYGAFYSPSDGRRETMLIEQTVRILHDMKLTGMAEAYKEQQEQPQIAELAFDDRFGMLVDRQCIWRDDRALKTRLHNARLKLPALIEDIDYQASRGLKRAQIEQLASSEWIRYHQNCIITGPTGTGKTFIACALSQKTARDGHRVRYYVAGKLFREIGDAHSDGSYGRLSVRLQKTELLVIDDWGMETLNAAQYRDLLEILDDRHGSGSTLVTSQFPVNLWHDTIGNPTLADAILDRLIHNAHRIELSGESLRKKKGKCT